MNLRISLILIILLSWVSVFGVLVYQSDIGKEKEEKEKTYFYRISSGDITNISITHNSENFSWHLGDNNRWYFDNLDGIPADSFRWGGIIDLLQGPQLYRTISEELNDKTNYGLDNPQTIISIYLENGDKRTLFIGNETPDLTNNYAYLEGDTNLVMVDATWKGVISRLVEEPPYPKWMYQIKSDDAIEMVFIKDNDIHSAFSKKDGNWRKCTIPLTSTPCKGNVVENDQKIKQFLEDFSKINIITAIKLNVMFEEDYREYGLGLEAPYVDVKTISKDSNGLSTVYNTSLSIGNVNEDKNGYYAVAKETRDIILIDKQWGDKILSQFN